MYRQTGRTTKQMETAPQGAVFLWVNAQTDYPKRLSQKIGREDLNIQSKHILGNGAVWFRGRRITGLVIDHAAQLTDNEYRGLAVAYASVMANKSLETDGQKDSHPSA